MKLNIGLLYISLYSLLRKKIGVNRTISKKDFYCILGKHFIIPKNLRCVVIKEMEQRELVKRENGENIRILDCDLELENNISGWYQKVGIY
jgi:uncharacterized protein (UPF0333 family)